MTPDKSKVRGVCVCDPYEDGIIVTRDCPLYDEHMTTPRKKQGSKAGFTPGPWKVEKIKAGNLVVTNKDNYVAIISFLNENGDEVEKANATLIASAPTMFKLIEDALELGELGPNAKQDAERLIAHIKGEGR